MIAISNALLYPAFAFLIGGLFLTLIPEKYKPTMVVTRKYFVIIVGSIVLLSLFRVFSVAHYVSTIFDLSIIDAMIRVLTSFNVGSVWLTICFISSILIAVLIFNKKNSFVGNYLSLFLSIALVIAISKGSHSASLEPSLGFIAHSIHYLSFSIWVGILFVIGLCAKDERNWPAFLKWYTPLALVIVLILSLSGFFLMRGIVPEYTNSLMLTYGQFLLVKHLLFLVIILYAFINGIVIRKKLKEDPSFRPKKWFRLESFFILGILTVTAFMTETTPPHNVASTLERVEPTKIFEWFHGSVSPNTTVVFDANVLTGLLLIVIFLCGFMVIQMAWRKWSLIYGALGGVSILVASYFLVMTAITVEHGIVSDGVVYTTIEEAIKGNNQVEDDLFIFQIGNRDENVVYVLYTVNHSQLISELLLKTENGFERITDSRLIIGGVPIKDSEHKIRTFLVTDGPWLQRGKEFTYVTFGYVQEPEEIAHVEIRYEGENKKVEVLNQSFFNISSSIVQWDPLHPILFYDKSGTEVGGYMRGFMESGAYCH